MKRERTKPSHRLGIAAALVALSVATPAFAGKTDNSVRFAAQATPGNIDPYFSNLAISGMTVWDNIWDLLTYRDPESGAYKGGLATAWRWIGDRTLELDLREGVKFHNGATFDADDVVFTLSYAAKPENRAAAFFYVRWIDRVEKLGRYKVRIVTKEPFPAAIGYLAMPRLAIFPHEYYAKVGPKGMNEHPVGSGPYRVVEHALGKYLRLARYPDHFQGSPKGGAKIDHVDIRFIPDAQTLIAEVVAGGLDLIADVARDQANQLRDIQGLRVLSGETTRYNYLLLNSREDTPSAPLRDVRVRQAIMHAIDRERIATFLAGEGARVLHAECHPSEFGCSDDSVQRYAYDPLKARQLLAEAGYPNGFDTDIYAYRDRNQAEALMGYLGAVGIRARLHYLQTAAAISARRAGKVPIAFLTGSNQTGDLPTVLTVLHEFSSDDLNRDPEVYHSLLLGDSSMDPSVRKTAYAKALALIAGRAYSLPLYTVPAYYVATKDLVFEPHTDEVLRFYEMSWK